MAMKIFCHAHIVLVCNVVCLFQLKDNRISPYGRSAVRTDLSTELVWFPRLQYDSG